MRLPQDRILHIDTEFAGDEVRVVAEWHGELVRCGECMHWYKKMNKCNRCPSISGNWGIHGFCSYGERKGGDLE